MQGRPREGQAVGFLRSFARSVANHTANRHTRLIQTHEEAPPGARSPSGATSSHQWAWVGLNCRPQAYQACAGSAGIPLDPDISLDRKRDLPGFRIENIGASGQFGHPIGHLRDDGCLSVPRAPALEQRSWRQAPGQSRVKKPTSSNQMPSIPRDSGRRALSYPEFMSGSAGGNRPTVAPTGSSLNSPARRRKAPSAHLADGQAWRGYASPPIRRGEVANIH